jgi:hypothetical protein
MNNITLVSTFFGLSYAIVATPVICHLTISLAIAWIITGSIIRVK